MESLTIWILQTGEPLHIDGGNVRPMRAMNLSNALVQRGHRVVLWSSAFYHQEKRHRSLTEQSIEVSTNLEIRLIPSSGYRRNISFARLIDHGELALNLKKMLRKIDALPDIVFIGYPPIETATILERWLTKRGVPSLLDVKDLWPLLFLDAVIMPLRPLASIFLWPYFYLARRTMRHATGLCAMTSDFLDWALEFADRKKTDMDGVFELTSPSGQVSKSELKEARLRWDKLGICDDGRARVCFVGSHSLAFDFKPVQEAAKIAANGNVPCEFIICGDGDYSSDSRRSILFDCGETDYIWISASHQGGYQHCHEQ